MAASLCICSFAFWGATPFAQPYQVKLALMKCWRVPTAPQALSLRFSYSSITYFGSPEVRVNVCKPTGRIILLLEGHGLEQRWYGLSSKWTSYSNLRYHFHPLRSPPHHPFTPAIPNNSIAIMTVDAINQTALDQKSVKPNSRFLSSGIRSFLSYFISFDQALASFASALSYH